MFKKLTLLLIIVFIFISVSIAEDLSVVGNKYKTIVNNTTYQLEFYQGPTGPCCSGIMALTYDNIEFWYDFQQSKGERLITVYDVGYLYQSNQNTLTYVPNLSDLIFTSVTSTTIN